MSIVNGNVGQNASWYDFYFDWWESNVNTSENKSDVTVVTYLKRKTSYSFDTVNSNQTQTININGNSASTNRRVDLTSISTGSSLELYRRTVTVEHNSDGSKSINISVSATTGGGYGAGNCSASANVTLSTIPRASKPSLITYPETTRNFNIGDLITIHCNRKSTNFTHTIWLNYGSSKIKIAENITDNFKFDTSKYLDTFYKFIPNNTQGIGSISLDTYNGSKLVGANSVEFTANVPENIVPVINNISIKEADEELASNPIFSKRKFFIQNVSKLNITIDAEGINYSTIKTYRVEVNDTIYNKSAFKTEPLKKYGDTFVKVSITDSRGRTTSFTQKIIVLEWSNPCFTDCSVFRSDKNGNEDSNGNNICLMLNGLYSYLNFINSVDLDIYYKKKNEKEYVFFDTITFSVYIDVDDEEGLLEQRGDFSTDEKIIISNIDTESSYDIKVEIHDFINSIKNTKSIYREWQVATVFTTIDYFKGGKGMALGKVAEKEGLEIAFLVTFLNGINPIEINNGDANEYKICNIYYLNKNNMNVPSENCYILVIGNGTTCLQVAFLLQELKIYMRSYNSEQWSEWQEK